MKKILFIFLMISLGFSLKAVTTITGQIADAKSQSPMEFVSIALFKQGSKIPVASAISDKTGSFAFTKIPDGKYSVRVSFVGYSPVNREVTVSGQPVNLGTIRLEEKGKELKEVEVIGRRTQMRFEADKKVFSIDQDIAAAGGSASDALKNIPSVAVDVEGNISLRNDPNVQVWINGKPSGLTTDNRAQILQQMPAENIQSIEIITNPSAKYSAEGSAGIINLVLKENRKAGYFGSVSAGLLYPDGGKLGGSLGANINYSSSKVDAYANIGYRNMNMKGGGWSYRYNYLRTDTTLLYQDNNSERSFYGVFTRAGIDWHWDQKNTIGFSGFGMSAGGKSTSEMNYRSTSLPFNNILKEYSRKSTQTGPGTSFNTTLDYQHDFDRKGTSLNSSLSYSHHKRGGDNSIVQNNIIPGYTSPDITQSSKNTSKNLQLNVDYTNKLDGNSKLEAGWQSSVNNSLSDAYGFYTSTGDSIPSYKNIFEYKEQIHAAYATYSNRLGQLNIQAGLRTEYMWKKSTNTTASAVQSIPSNTYLELFPSIYLSYTLPGDNELQLNYSRRVNRPRGQQINPFRNYTDSTTITYGNPGLSPQFVTSMEFNYIKTWDNHTLSISAYYRYTDNVIQNVRFLHAGTMESTYMNITQSQRSGMEVIGKSSLSGILDITPSLNLYYSKLDSATYTNPYDNTLKTTIPQQDNFSWIGKLIVNIRLANTFTGQVTGQYTSAQLIAQGKRNPNYSLDLGLRKTYFDRKLTISATARDLLNTNKNKSVTSGTGYSQTSESYFHGRMFGLTVSYNFGNMKPKREDKKKQENPEMEMEDIEE